MGSCHWLSTVHQNQTIILLGFLLFSDDLGLHSQLRPCCNPFPSSSLLFILTPWWVHIISPVLFHKIKCRAFSYLAMISSSVLKFIHVTIHFHPRHRFFTSLPNGFLSFVEYWTSKSICYCWEWCDIDMYVICQNPCEYYICISKLIGCVAVDKWECWPDGECRGWTASVYGVGWYLHDQCSCASHFWGKKASLPVNLLLG